jgi:SH3-like domain-containing protein
MILKKKHKVAPVLVLAPQDFLIMVRLTLALLFCLITHDSFAAKQKLPVPRFASLRSSEINVRVGPGNNYPIAWVFVRTGLPVEVTAEFDTWRRIRFADQSEGWVHQTYWIKGDHTPLRAQPAKDAHLVAYLEEGVHGPIVGCKEGWCQVQAETHKGWLPIESLWGAHPNSVVDATQ